MEAEEQQAYSEEHVDTECYTDTDQLAIDISINTADEYHTIYDLDIDDLLFS